eukprot:Hpha_TRINITY_DN15810_c1_g3::TRINITY_DN15810_c1_g3_i1::g.191304::m.191304
MTVAITEVLRDEEGNLTYSVPMPPDAVKTLDVDVEERVLRVTATGVNVTAHLPAVVDGDRAQAKYQKKKQVLVVTMPIIREVEASDFPVGSVVEVCGIKGQKDLNGLIGSVKTHQGARVGVQLPSPCGNKALKPANLRLVSRDHPAAKAIEAEEEAAALASLHQITLSDTPAPFHAEDTVAVGKDSKALELSCKKSKLPWHAGKAQWCGKDVVVNSIDLRDRTAQVRAPGLQSLCWFPFESLTKVSSAAKPGGVSVGGD